MVYKNTCTLWSDDGHSARCYFIWRISHSDRVFFVALHSSSSAVAVAAARYNPTTLDIHHYGLSSNQAYCPLFSESSEWHCVCLDEWRGCGPGAVTLEGVFGHVSGGERVACIFARRFRPEGHIHIAYKELYSATAMQDNFHRTPRRGGFHGS